MKICTVTALVTLVGGAWFLLRPDCDILLQNIHYLQDRTITQEAHNVCIVGEKIARISRKKLTANKIVEGGNYILAPGFLDTNTAGWVAGNANIRKLYDGVTTYLNAHGGGSGDAAMIERNPKKDEEGIKINYATSFGLMTLRRDVLLHQDSINWVVEKSLEMGDYGPSLSPEYNAFTTEAVVEKVCLAAAGKPTIVSFHTRYSEKDTELKGLEEALHCSDLGADIHILHLNSTGGTHQPDEALRMIAARQAAGRTVIVDFYPYTYWLSGINMARFEGNWLKRYNIAMSNVRVGGIDKEMSKAEFDNLKTTSAGRLMVSVDSMPQATIDKYAMQPGFFMGSDSDGTNQNTHPRASATFTKYLADYVKTGKVDLGETLYRFSTEAHRAFAKYIPGLEKRGEIKEGYYADLIVWDMSKVAPMASIASPLENSRGVVAAFVNGQPAILDKEVVPAPKAGGKWLPGRLFVKGTAEEILNPK